MSVGIILIAVVASLLAGAAFLSARAAQGQVKARRAELAALHETLKTAQARQNELQKKAEERQDELREVKQDLAALRKKHHGAQEEGKALREQLRSQAEERDSLRNRRPAFEGTATPAAPVAPAKSKAKDAATASPPPQQRHEPVSPSSSPDASAAPVAAARPPFLTEERSAQLVAENRELAAKLVAVREQGRGEKAELARLRTYTEQLRRIDIIAKGQLEILEDKLAGLGRDYYEAVSELAALKGQVIPPSRHAPRSAPVARAPKAADSTDDGHPGEALASEVAD